MARFFIERPVFAWVISLLIILAGLLAIRGLPVAQYPDIAPPVVNISATYPGASAKVIEESVTAIIEREMNGAPGLMYISATSSPGTASLSLTFRQGTNPDLAAVEVQNRLKTVEARLPEVVRRNGIFIEKSADSIQLIVSLTSEGNRLTEIELGELAAANVLQALRRVEGVGKVQIWSPEYAMRIWPDPAKLTAMNLSASDVASAIRSHNARVTVGDLGNRAVPDHAPISANVISDSALTTPEDFERIPLRTRADGSAILLKDVARVEFGGSDYAFVSRVNGNNAAGMAVKMAPGSNAVATVKRIRATMDELVRYLPAGVSYQIPYDTSAFVEISIEKVVHTLLEAIVLVFLVMFLFMQNLRATLIPTIVVPIALLGTFAVMLAAGFSINVLSMFGMVLAIGIVVDDAIVVVENVERIMAEEGLPPLQATIKAMKQISGAIIGITVVLISVFVPMAFFSGAVGNIYRQFSMSLAVSIAFSAFLALSLTPALCATLLKPIIQDHHEKRGFFGWFNRMFAALTGRYQQRVGAIIKRPIRWLVVYGTIIAVVVFMFVRLPTAFLPDEDQGDFMITVLLPAGATMHETMGTLAHIAHYLNENEPVKYVYEVGGFSFYGTGSNSGMIFATLKDWKEREDAGQHVKAIVDRVNMQFMGLKNTTVFAVNTPPLPELGSSNGFDLRLQDRGSAGYQAFLAAKDQLMSEGMKSPVLTNLIFAGLPEAALVNLDIDRRKAEALGVGMDEINITLASMFGSDYIGDFMHGNQVRRVIMQADGKDRLELEDIRKLRVRSSNGSMVPLSSIVQLEWISGPPQLTRYNGYPSFTINGNAAPGYSSGEAMQAIEGIARSLPRTIGYDWSGQSLEERRSGAQAPMLFGLSVLIVFLALAALYESWLIPLAVILVVPLGILGALLGVTLRDMPNDIYFKVGLIATIGLSAKNAILIVEVAKDLYADGMGLMEATLEAARLRLRPIVMTSLAFGVGVLPLAIATGAASGAQSAIGTSVLGGIITATLLAIFLVPLFFAVIGRYIKRPQHHTRESA
ncbi:multidrug efflux RND transporter permease subunit [Methylobacillus flagellatus]|uniref:Efflux pump membrane transporter n=1 Tax=Methylobacillus flagellatus (strain ATCC 51484 / DSM 6875 / VKM B-1610 / KT) TaxID=265072 RepID=Q1H1K9_METFK|nr:multidrug efflux RND transporter permease subunit [Methylobacillus flagellatus]ABE49628.1 Hydrophobe/amphiphile efflux-1 HAE1 [Methylobacillus flagellatus KT]